MALTAEQIAKRVGLSNATVSRVLNNTQYVSPEAREAVLAAIREAGETPRLLGRRNRQKSPGSAPAPGQSGFVEILMITRFPPNTMERAAASQQARLTSSEAFAVAGGASTDSPSPSLPLHRIDSYSRHIVDGIIGELRHVGLRGVVQMAEGLRNPSLLAEVNKPQNRGVFLIGIYDDDVLEFIDKCRCPIVSFVTWDHNGWPDYVGIDNVTGIRLAFDHLRSLGHTRIGYVAGELKYSHVFRQRLAAYKMCMVDADLRWRPEWITEGSCELEPIEAGVETILRSPERPTAIMCAFDGAAVAAKRVADKLGLQVPRDLSVVGFNADDIAQLFSPPLTTVRVPTELMGRHAVHLMAMRQQRPIARGEGVSIRVTPTLTVRQSTCPPRA